LFQLFTGLYVLQLCLIGLFALGARGCLPQVVIMSFALICTAFYHRKLVEVYSPLFSRTAVDGTSTYNAGLLDKEMYPPPRDEKAKGFYREDSASSSNDQERVRQPVLTTPRPVVWIPQDQLGVSDDEIRETRKMHGMGIIPITNANATLDSNGRVACRSPKPPLQDSIEVHDKRSPHSC
jgi:Extracellular tail, of 10TM putative phosphate transporter